MVYEQTQAKLEDAIENGEEASQNYDALAGELRANAVKLRGEVKEHEGVVAERLASIADEDGIQKERIAVFNKNRQDHLDTIKSIDSAMVTIAAMQTPKPGKNAAKEEERDPSALLLEVQKKVPKVFLQVTGGAPQAAAYAASQGSSAVATMLGNIKSKLQDDMNTGAREHKAWVSNSQQIILEMQNDVESLRTQISQKNTRAGGDEAAAEENEKSKVAQDEVNATNKKNLDDIRAECNIKRQQYDERQKLRVEEEQAITQAISIIEGASAKRVTQVAKAEGDYKGAAKDGPVFLQLGSKGGPLQRAVALLDAAGKKQNNKALQLLALKMSEGGPFDKVVQLCKDLVQDLKAQAMAEETKNAACTRDMEKNKNDIENSQREIKDLNTAIETATTQIQKLSKAIESHNAEVGENNGAKTKYTALWNKQKKTLAAEKADAEATIPAIEQARKLLADFYAKASEASSLTQQPAAVEVTQSGPTWDRAYTGNQGAGNSVLGLLEQILADFQAQKQNAEINISDGEKEFTKAMNDFEVRATTLKASIQNATEEKSSKQGVLNQKTQDLKSQSDLLANYNEQKINIEQTRGCLVAGSMSPDEIYGQRKAARETEIAALKQALEILEDSDRGQVQQESTTGLA